MNYRHYILIREDNIKNYYANDIYSFVFDAIEKYKGKLFSNYSLDDQESIIYAVDDVNRFTDILLKLHETSVDRVNYYRQLIEDFDLSSVCKTYESEGEIYDSEERFFSYINELHKMLHNTYTNEVGFFNLGTRDALIDHNLLDKVKMNPEDFALVVLICEK